MWIPSTQKSMLEKSTLEFIQFGWMYLDYAYKDITNIWIDNHNVINLPYGNNVPCGRIKLETNILHWQQRQPKCGNSNELTLLCG